MSALNISQAFSVKDKVIAITGGTGILGSEIGCTLAENGAKVIFLDLNPKLPAGILERLNKAQAEYMVLKCNVLEKESIRAALDDILSAFGKTDVLINGAGGNHPKATTGPDLPFFDIAPQTFNRVVELNLAGTVLPSQIFGRYFARNKSGVIINISSMNAFRPLTRIPAYSAAKAAVSNFTQWLATHLAQEYSANIRVNAIAPGFFMTKQNRYLLIDEKTDELTERGKQILAHTPAGRFGDPQDLISTIVWLISPASSFVTGIVVPIDGGFSAFSGV